MVLTKKTRQQISAAANGSMTEKVVQNLPRKSRVSVSSWAILDEIEAPMWADLTLECDSTYGDKDDEWFHTSHPFHQCSARELISTFSQSLDFQGPSSPNLPISVSKSRGKDYKSKKQEPVVCSLTINKQQPFSSSGNRSSLTNEGSEKKTKNNSLNGKLDDHKSDSIQQSSKSSAKSVAFGSGESNSVSTITSDATSGKLIEASNQPVCLTSGLLLNLRNSIRKSYVTRQASRVEIKGMSSQSGQKSSCVGSTESMEETPDSRNVVHKAPASQAQNMSCKSDLRIKKKASKIMDHEKRTEGYVAQKVNKFIPAATTKSSSRARGINQSSRTVNGGKENQSGKMALVTKSSVRVSEAKGPLQDPKVVTRKPHQGSQKTKLVGQRENCSSGSKVEKTSRKVDMVYFR